MTTPVPEDRIDGSRPIEPGPTAGQPSGAAFQSYMEGAGKQSKGTQAGTPGAFSPGTAPPGTSPQAGTPSPQTLAAQIATSQDSLSNVQNQLNKIKAIQEKNPNAQLSRSQTHLIRNKLNDANTYLRAANSKMGAEAPPAPSPSGHGPIERFLSYIVDGENQMQAARQKLGNLSKNGDQLRPADLLLIQIKLNQAEQEISYASMLLSKVVTSFSQLISTQL